MFLDSAPDCISDVENAQDLNLALEVAEYFRVNNRRANAIIEEVVVGVKEWRPLAESLRISLDEIEQMEPSFRSTDTILLQFGYDPRSVLAGNLANEGETIIGCSAVLHAAKRAACCHRREADRGTGVGRSVRLGVAAHRPAD